MTFLRSMMCALLLAGSAWAGGTPPPNIILITIDTTRADRMGFLGSKLGLTPNLDKLARQSVVFSQAYAHVPLTVPSHATILTGTYPQFSHVEDMGDPLGKDVPYLPAILHEHGYHTAAFVGSQVLDPKSVAAPGFDRGFEVYDAGFHSRRQGESRYLSVERRGDEVVKRASEWIERQQAGPFFVWVHLYDPHDPYDPPPPFKARFASSPYDGEIAYVDSAVGRLLDVLRARGLYEQSVIAVMADHGEAFGEHGERGHGVFLYDETLHVPLVIKLRAEQAGRRVESRVGLVDVAPTLLQEAGIAVPESMQGESLGRVMAGDKPHAKRDLYSESDYARRAFGWSPLYAWRAGKYLFIRAPQRELYNQASDPGALHNLAAESGAIADTLASELAAFRQKTSRAGQEQAAVSPELADKLQALGYVASSSANTRAGPSGVDPKQKIEIANLLHEGLLDVEEERYNDAIPPLKKVVKDQPEIALANLALGQAHNRMENFQEAVPWLRQAVKLSPTSGRAHQELGIALAQNGDWASAATEFKAALDHAPDSSELHFQLAGAYEQLGRAADARSEYETALLLSPDNFDANLMLGRLLGMQNDPVEALPYVQKAVSLQPKSADAHKFLANIYTELGDSAKAQRERDEAERLKAASGGQSR